MFTLEASGALVQLGDPAARVDRVKQEMLARMQGLTRATVTKRISRIAAPDVNWTQEKRRQQAERMRAIAAKHPHWNKDATKKGLSELPEAQVNELQSRGSLIPGVVPRAGNSLKAKLSTGREPRCILTRNAGFAAANSYAFAMPDTARPGLKAESDPTQHAAILAAQFGEHVYDREAMVNGFRNAWGWAFDEHLPDAPDCDCRGNSFYSPENVCPKCEGKGFTIGGSLPDFGRVLLHWLNDRGIDEEIRQCEKCKRNYSQANANTWPKCPGCQGPGHVAKPRGILTGWTQKRIGEANALHVSTVRRYFRTFRRLALVRTVYGKVWRECCEKGKWYDQPTCPKCGNKCGAIKKREPWKILWLPSRTLDRDLVKAERERLEALVRWHRRFLEARQQESLAAAAALAGKVLGEWAGQEHQLSAFYHEMRRRLGASTEFSRYLNVLFPINSS